MLALITGRVKERDCAKCERTPELREVLGCEKETAQWPFEIEYAGQKEQIRRCPVALLRERDSGIWGVVQAYGYATRGECMPIGGGLLAQSATLIQAFDVLRQGITEADEAAAKKREQHGREKQTASNRSHPTR